MRRRSLSYSPQRRGYGGRGRSPPRGRYGGHRDAPCGLLVRNIPKDSRAEEVRAPFERFGRIRDVYLPKDYYTGEPRGFGFVQYLDPVDAAEAKRHMDRQIFRGREITVVFAEENRKRPDEMRMKGRSRGRMSYGGYRRSPYRGQSPSLSPGDHSPSPRSGRYSRSNNVSSRRDRYGSLSPSSTRSRTCSRSPDTHRKGRGSSPGERSYSPHSKDGRTNVDAHKKGGRHSASPERSSQLKDGQAKSPRKRRRISRSASRSPESERYSRSPQKVTRSRSKSWRESRSPHSPSPPPRQRHLPALRCPNSKNSPDPVQKTYSSLTPEERSPNGDSQSPGQSQ